MNLKRHLSHVLPSLVLVTLTVACAGPESQDSDALSNPPAPVPSEGVVSPPGETSTGKTPDASGSVSQFSFPFTYCGNFCPSDSVPRGILCAPSCPGYDWQAGQCTGNYNAVYCEYYAMGTVSANPKDVWINTNATSLGTTQICWSVRNTTTGEVWVSMDGMPEQLFTRASSGCETAGWIQVGHSYRFTLYEGLAHSNQLATTTVTGYGYQGLR